MKAITTNEALSLARSDARAMPTVGEAREWWHRNRQMVDDGFDWSEWAPVALADEINTMVNAGVDVATARAAAMHRIAVAVIALGMAEIDLQHAAGTRSLRLPCPLCEQYEPAGRFQFDRYYRHSTGKMMHVLANLVTTKTWGRTMLAEQQDGEIVPVGDGADNAVNWFRSTRDEWDKLFDEANRDPQ